MRCGYLILFQSNRVGKSDPLDDIIRSMINHVTVRSSIAVIKEVLGITVIFAT